MGSQTTSPSTIAARDRSVPARPIDAHSAAHSPRSHTSHFVSVVIPCYNQGRFLDEAIQSVFRQTHTSLEVIVIDDGSTDRTPEVARAYDRLHYVRQANRGVTSARNLGLQLSSGTFVAFLDADDRLLPRAIEIGLQSLADNPLCALTFGSFCMIDVNGNRKGPAHSLDVKPYAYKDFLERNLIGNPGVALYRREALLSVDGFDPTNQAAGDYDLYLRLSHSYPITCHKEVVLEYRRHGRNMSDDPAVMLASCLGALRRQWRLVKGTPALESAYHRGLVHWRQYYGERLVIRLYEHLALRGWSGSFRCLSHLAMNYPERLVRGLRSLPTVYSSAFRNKD